MTKLSQSFYRGIAGSVFAVAGLFSMSNIILAAPAPEVRNFTSTISPTTSAISVTKSYMVTVTNNANSTKKIEAIRISIPSGFTNVSSIVVAGDATNWSVATTSSLISIKKGNNDINGGKVVTVSFSAKAPSSGGSYTWTTRAYGKDDYSEEFTITSSQPVVTVPVADTTAPVISGTPSDIIAEAAGATGKTVTFTAPTAIDAVDGAVSVSCVPSSGSLFGIAVTMVTCTATDAASNSASTSFTVTVRDTTLPTVVINLPTQTVEATSASGATASFAASATDTVDGTLTPTCNPISGSTFALGTATVTCTATDTRGNTGTSTATVIVADTTGPVVTITGDTNMSLNTSDTYTESGATANDAVDGEIVPVVGGDTVNTSVVAVYYVTYEATDSRGNKTKGTRTVSVSDSDAPVIEKHDDVTAEATSSSGATVSYTNPTANDDVDGEVDVTCTPESDSVFTIGTTPITCTATDSSENTATSGFDVIVNDTTAPTVGITPSTQTLEAASSTGAIASYVVSAIDIVDGDISVGAVCSPASATTFAMGTTTIACSSTDLHNNTSSSTATVIVVDTTVPIITPPVDQTFEATGATTTPTLIPATVIDIVDPAPIVTYDIHNFVVGTTTVTWKATDTAGNVATTTSNVVINEAPAPIITNETAVSPTETSMTITWTTNHNATSRVIYDTVSHSELGGAPNYGYANSTTEDATLVTSHSVVVSGLSSGTTYYFRTVSHGSPETVSNEVKGTTSTPTPVTPAPSPVSNFVGGIGGSGGGGGGAVSGPLSFGYQGGSSSNQPTVTENENTSPNSTVVASNNQNTSGTTTGEASNFGGNGRINNGAESSSGTSTANTESGTSNENQTAAVGSAVGGLDFSNWVQWLLLALILAGVWYWFVPYRRRKEK